ncbi:MAG TPA: hypothetical protein VHZ95_02915 [Polyangiales bacterium]|nr:hypothetical protein [Polyangiales bacterium]
MLKFVAGFALASVLWGAFIVSVKQGWIDISLEPEAPPEDANKNVASGDSDEPDKPGRVRHKRANGAVKHRVTAPSGDSLSGDDLNENEARSVNMGANGGEEQLRGTEIEQGFDGVFPQVRRCLMLAAGDEPAQGKLVFGLRISSDGKVNAVNLSGPSSVTQGEAGACLRKAAQGMHLRSFHGPDMVVHYPLNLQ